MLRPFFCKKDKRKGNAVMKLTGLNAMQVEESRRQHRELLERAKAAAASGAYDLVVLDEAIGTVSIGLLDEGDLLGLIGAKAPETELVMTGRGLPAAVAERCDYISEIVMRKHPFEQGIGARRGIEY